MLTLGVVRTTDSRHQKNVSRKATEPISTNSSVVVVKTLWTFWRYARAAAS